MIGAVLATLLGLLVNLMLIFAVLRSRRWFLMHWLVLHVTFIIILFISSILLFVIQPSLWKLLGIVPVIVALLIMYCWTKVWELFTALGEHLHQESLDHLAARVQHQVEGRPQYTKNWLDSCDKDWSQEFQFYPGDPLSHGMARRLEGVMRGMEGTWRGSWPHFGGIGYDEMMDSKHRGGGKWRDSVGMVQYELSHEYEGESSSTCSSIVSPVNNYHTTPVTPATSVNNYHTTPVEKHHTTPVTPVNGYSSIGKTTTLEDQNKLTPKTSLESKTDSNVSAVVI